MPYTLPDLPYEYAALEPHIDEQTMRLHHDKHHQTYLDKLNEALAKHPDLQPGSPEDLLRDLAAVPEDIRTAVKNNGGGYVNHTMFWESMSPQGGGEPTGKVAEAIQREFGSFTDFQRQFEEEGTKRFGSGWVWLVHDPQKGLRITSTANQDSPLSEGLHPLLGNDVWEHAYYLKYQNRRAEYLKAWWNVVNWQKVEQRMQAV
jgi:Fe-Mn family superoxide dismutase